MPRLELQGVCVSHNGSRLSGIDAAIEGRSLCLVGQWGPLVAALAGRVQLDAGRILLDEHDARALVVAGRLGVADPELLPPPNATLLQWLTLNLRLFGVPAKQAETQARDTLGTLRLEAYGGYVVERFPASTLWVARVALAFATRPSTVVLPPPTWVAETMALESAVLGLVQSQASVILACDPALQPELFFAADGALVLDANHGSPLLPAAVRQGGSRPYALVALARREALVQRLTEAGVTVHNPDSEGELWVQLPVGAGTDVLLRAAVEAGAALTRLTPLFETRAGG